MSHTDRPLEIVYRDDDLVAINKPAGLLVHKSPIDRHETRFAIQLLRDQIGQRVYPLHRLDKPTSGVLLFALSPGIAAQVSSHWHTEVHKTYVAIVRGLAPDTAEIDHPISYQADDYVKRPEKQPAAQPARTQILRLANIELPNAVDKYPSSRYSLVQCKPLTGRRHQIRRHLKHISHPIIGDAKHGKGKHNRFFAENLQAPGLLLSAVQFTLPHPVSGAVLIINAPLRGSMAYIINRFDWHQAIHPQWLDTYAP
ncbi:MAG TPA: pseudouridine synthase [Cellvibrionaceae bacterium]